MMMKNKNQNSQRRRRVHHHDQDVEFVNVHITEDLIFEILLRVPAITVLSFKCVCKNWYSLISNPDFLRSHSSFQFEKRTDLLIHVYNIGGCPFSTHFEFLFLPQDQLQLPLQEVFHPHPVSLFPENRRHCQLEDSCNGLLLLRFSDADDFNVGNLTYYIFNLITKHYFKLPSTNPLPNIKEKDFVATSSHIMFDPSVSHSYKVIQCWLKDDSESPDNIHCQLYSSETGSWRLLSTSFPMNPFEVGFCFEFRPTLLNGVLYWSYGTTSLDVSYYFDAEKESVSFLPLPPKPIGCDFRECLYFGECGGRLRLIEKYFLDDMHDELQLLTLPCSFDIFEMDPEHQHQECQDHCRPWIVKYHVNIKMVSNRPFLRELPCVVEFIHCYKVKNKGGEEEEVLFLSINQTSIVSYNLTSNTFGKELTVSNNTFLSYEFSTFFPFTPTLSPIS